MPSRPQAEDDEGEDGPAVLPSHDAAVQKVGVLQLGAGDADPVLLEREREEEDDDRENDVPMDEVEDAEQADDEIGKPVAGRGLRAAAANPHQNRGSATNPRQMPSSTSACGKVSRSCSTHCLLNIAASPTPSRSIPTAHPVQTKDGITPTVQGTGTPVRRPM